MRVAYSFLSLILGASLLAPVGIARAQPADPCLTAPVEGQQLRKRDKLVEARAQFTICARETCPSEISQRCSSWMEEVQAAMPSIVLAARDARGRDLLDVTVSVDGGQAAPLGTRGMDLDPGEHRFIFQRAGARDVLESIVLRDGEKDREVVATFGDAVSQSAPAPAVAAPHAARTGDALETEPRRPIPVTSWVLGGLGLAALATFGVFGTLGVAERANDHCDPTCPGSATTSSQAQRDDIGGKFVVADVSLGVGIVALAAATIVYLARPSVAPRSSAFFDVRPALRGGASAAVGLRF